MATGHTIFLHFPPLRPIPDGHAKEMTQTVMLSRGSQLEHLTRAVLNHIVLNSYFKNQKYQKEKHFPMAFVKGRIPWQRALFHSVIHHEVLRILWTEEKKEGAVGGGGITDEDAENANWRLCCILGFCCLNYISIHSCDTANNIFPSSSSSGAEWPHME